MVRVVPPATIGIAAREQALAQLLTRARPIRSRLAGRGGGGVTGHAALSLISIQVVYSRGYTAPGLVANSRKFAGFDRIVKHFTSYKRQNGPCLAPAAAVSLGPL